MQLRLPLPLILKPRLPLWTDGTTWTNWFRHEAYLRSQPKWKPHQIASVAEESLRIISKTTPVSRPEFQCRGLVVGYVQSGKTANFTAVAARAADVGYRLINPCDQQGSFQIGVLRSNGGKGRLEMLAE